MATAVDVRDLKAWFGKAELWECAALLVAISDHPLAGGCDVLRRMSWLICRAFRRMARIVDAGSLKLAKNFACATPGRRSH